MDLKGNFNDVSDGDMLLEASGDSEADFKGQFSNEIHHIFDDDDAMSCSYDHESEAGNTDQLKEWECLNGDAGDDDDDDDDEKKKKKNEVFGSSYCEDDEMQEQCHHKSCVSDDSGLDEMEKNRLFWEACLAS